jgi:hypothetical protein
MLLGFLVLLGLFVTELAEVHEPAHGWGGGRRDLNQINPVGPGGCEGIPQGQHAELLAINSDEPYFAGTNLPVDSKESCGRRRRTWSKRATQDTLVGLSLFMQLSSVIPAGTMPGHLGSFK